MLHPRPAIALVICASLIRWREDLKVFTWLSFTVWGVNVSLPIHMNSATSLKHNRSTLTEFVDNSLAEDFSMEPWTGGVPHTADQQRCLNNCEDQAEGLPSLAVEKMGIVLEDHVQGELCYLSYERSNINERIQPTPRTL